jgi:hypothetical protein
MDATCSSETSVATQHTTRRHIPEDDTLHSLGRFIQILPVSSEIIGSINGLIDHTITGYFYAIFAKNTQ